MESEYVNMLGEPAHNRYQIKIAKYIDYDLHRLRKSDFFYILSDLPGVAAIDITNYLVLKTSSYCQPSEGVQESYFVCGWVNNLGSKAALNECHLVDDILPSLHRCFNSNIHECATGSRLQVSCLTAATIFYLMLQDQPFSEV